MPRILIVEDDAAIRASLASYLAKLGHTIAQAANGWEALLGLEESRADLILLDMVMPGMNGAVFLRVLRADPRHAKIPVIIMTAQDTETAAVNSREFDIANIVPKTATLLPDMANATREILG